MRWERSKKRCRRPSCCNHQPFLRFTSIYVSTPQSKINFVLSTKMLEWWESPEKLVDDHYCFNVHPLLQEKYTGLETARLWKMFGWSRSSKYLPSTVKIWSHDPNIWVHRHQIYNIWHALTRRFLKIYTLLGQNGTYPYMCLARAVQFPTSNS